MEFSKLESLNEYLRKEYGVPSVLEIVGRRFVFIFKPKKNEVSAMVGTITGAVLEYPLNYSEDSEDPIAMLDLAIQAPDYYLHNKRCIPKEITAFMYIDDPEDPDEKLKWVMYFYSSLEKYMEGDNEEAFDGEFRLLD